MTLSLIFAVFGSLGGTADAGTFALQSQGFVSAPTGISLDVDCGTSARSIGGYGLVEDATQPGVFGGHRTFTANIVRNIDEHYLAQWPMLPGAVHSTQIDYDLTSVCTTHTSCIEVVDTAVAIGDHDEITHSVQCPQGMFAISGGFRVTGDPVGIEVRGSGPTGMFASKGWRAQARRVASSDEWGLAVEARCVPVSVVNEVTPTYAVVASDLAITSDPGWPVVAQGWVDVMLPSGFGPDSLVLGHGARASGVGGLAAFQGNRIYSQYFGQAPFPDGQTEITGVDMLLSAVDVGAFDDALYECDSIPVAKPYFEIGADIWLGVTAGGGGIIFLPGSGPVPIDPAPFKVAFESLPAAVTTYANIEELDLRLSEITAGLDEAGNSWALLTSAEETIDQDFGADGVAFVVPDNEVEAIEWLSDNRERLAALAHPTLVFLAEGGEGWEALQSW